MSRRRPRGRGARLACAAAVVVLAGCSASDEQAGAATRAVAPVEATPAPAESLGPETAGPAAPVDTEPARGREASVARRPATPAPARTAPEPPRSFLSIPAIGLRSVPVVRYRGTPDDAGGTRIQDRGPTASPRGRGGGVGPGDVGNFIVTGHRTSHTAPFRELPRLRPGDRVRIRSAGTLYVYRVTTTRSTSFRSPRSLAEQSAAVPGRPGAEPVRPMITLSTCATPEDHAAGNYWSDRFGNPEHRIDKVGVLVATRPAGD